MYKGINFWKLLISIFVCESAGLIGSFFTRPAINSWYATLFRPTIAPPNWIFAPVWIALFLLMGISFYLIWNKGIKSKEEKIAAIVFGFQLVLNVMWTFLFFGLKAPFLAFLEIIILWVAIILTAFYFYRISKAAGILLIPYILWVGFAIILNFSFYYLNR
jgi:translocator protein